ncbi:MAG: family 2 glycosyl transferase [Parcubacteria group bacterium Gr01-1014_38]|nr:MAG: family 2 glycosyl transferase [Parcubacteria group bacterium Gr01-1014_38]
MRASARASVRGQPKLFAIFIAYNAEKALAEFWRVFPKELFHRVILVDDASKDRTFALAQELGIESYRNEVNRGYGGNLKRALNIALEQGADIIVDIHPDGEYKTSAIAPALQEIERGAEFVLGNRFSDGHDPIKSGMFIWKVPVVMLLDALCTIVLRLPIRDYHQGFRVYARSLLEKVNYHANADDFSFSAQLLAQAAFHRCAVSQVPVEVQYTGKKRGASLKNSILYTVQTLGVLAAFLLAKLGFPSKVFRKPDHAP